MFHKVNKQEIFIFYMKQRLENIKNIFTKRKSILIFLISIILYSIMNFFINDFHIIGLSFFHSPVWYVTSFIIFTLINTILIGITINLIITRISYFNISGGIIGFFGAFITILTGACPGCIAGILPAFLAFFGTTFALSSLPLYGIEFKIFSFIMMLSSVYLLSGDVKCKINYKK